MNTTGNPSKKVDKRVLLSTLWIVVMINMLKADVLSLYIPGAVDELAQFAGATPIPLLMLAGALLSELAIVMIILSRALTYRLNRWANVVVGCFTIVYIWAGRAAYPHYTFIAAVETVCLLLVVWNAWTWTEREE
jgi:hypothetical protein